jgi:hypothetical protein
MGLAVITILMGGSVMIFWDAASVVLVLGGTIASCLLNYPLNDVIGVVARRLKAFGLIPLEQFEITACGSSQPVAANTTEQGQQANRRVEVYVRGAFNRDRIEALRKRTNALVGEQATEAVSSPEALPSAM